MTEGGPSLTQAAGAAGGFQNVADGLGSVRIPGSGTTSEAAAEALQRAQQHARILVQSADSLQHAVGKHTDAETAHRAAAPSPEEIADAESAVSETADKVARGEASPQDLDTAVEELSELLAEKSAADAERDESHDTADDDLTDAASGLTDPSMNPAMNPEAMNPPMTPMTPMTPMPMDQGAQPPMGATPGPDSPFSSIPDSGTDSRRRGADPLNGLASHPFGLDGDRGEGRTHLAGAENAGGHGNTLVGKPDGDSVGTGRGVSAVSNFGQPSGRGGMPMGMMGGGGMPMGMGQGMGNMAGKGGKPDRRKDFTVVENPNADGQDIDEKYGTSGEIRGSSG